MWALLTLYQALRIAITDAVTAVPGTDPDQASYQVAVQTACCPSLAVSTWRHSP